MIYLIIIHYNNIMELHNNNQSSIQSRIFSIKKLIKDAKLDIINPLNNRILRKNLNIDTRFRDNYYTSVSSNFHLDLPIRFTKIVSMQLQKRRNNGEQTYR